MRLTSLLAITAITMLFAILTTSSYADAEIYVKIDGIKGDVTTQGYDSGEWFVANSFSFGVEREMKESGEKGGTEDINIGVGELQECTVSKSMDNASAKLAQFAINGNSPGKAEIHFVDVPEDGSEAIPYLVYKLDRAFITSWSTSADGDGISTEEVAINYNKIAFGAKPNPDSGEDPDNIMSWDLEKNNHGKT